MASNSPMPTWTAHDACDEDYCCSWQQLTYLHQQRIALWQRSAFPHDAQRSPQRSNFVHILPPSLEAEQVPTGCPTSSPPTPSRRPTTSVTALPTAQMPPSGFLYSPGTARPVEQLPVEAQLPSICGDVRFMQDLLTYQHNQLRAQEIYSRLLSNQAEQLKHQPSACSSQVDLALNALAQAQVAYTRLKEDFDCLASDFLAYTIWAEAEFRNLSATFEPIPAQINIARRMAALP